MMLNLSSEVDESIVQINENLFIIKLEPPIKGFKNFIAAWLYKCSSFNALIDVGPSVTSEQLLNALAFLKVEFLDYIFLTHIHLDHAGAVGRVVSLFKDALVVCHRSGIPHLINPKVLWEGSLKALNKVAFFYGKPEPVSDSTIFTSNVSKLFKKNAHNIEVINTPGHSSHHISVCIDDYMFIGEAAGVLIKNSIDNIYMRPATPPPLFSKTYINSINAIKNITKMKPKLLCYAHLSVINSDNHHTLNDHCDQFELWMSIMRKRILLDKGKNEILLIEECVKILLEQDPFLRSIKQMDKQTQNREFFFIKNSIRGFIQNISINLET